MKRAIVVVMVGAAVLFGAAASAQNQMVRGSARLAWDACPGSPGASDQTTFSCDPTSAEAETLYATYSVNGTIPLANSWDATLDFVVDGLDVPPFWHFQLGACNEFGIQVGAQRPAPASVPAGAS